MSDDVSTIIEAFQEAKWPLLDAIYRQVKFAAEFEVSAGSYDRPIAETPWLERYGNDKYDARWYAVMGAKDHAIEGMAGAIDDALFTFWTMAFLAGKEARRD